MSLAVSAKQRRRDKDFTAQFYYDRWLQVKCIEAWKIYTTNPQVNNDADSIALESHTNTLLSVGVDDSRSSNRPSSIVLDDDALPVNPRATLSLKSPSPQSYRAKAQKETKEVEAAKFHKSKKKPKRKMSAKKKRVLLPGRVGLTNLGNTCYINSVFQALSHTKLFGNISLNFVMKTLMMKLALLTVAAVAVVQKTRAALVIMMIVMTLQRGRGGHSR